MFELISRLAVYRNEQSEKHLFNVAEIIREYKQNIYDKDKASNLLYDEVYEILQLNNYYFFGSDIWKNYIIYVLIMSENPFSLEIERFGDANDVLKEMAKNDFGIFIKLMDYDFGDIEKDLQVNCFTLINKKNNRNKELINNNANKDISYNLTEKFKEIKDLLIEERNIDVFYDKIVSFYKKYGVGKFGLFKAFRISHDNLIIPITGTSKVVFSNLIGYEEQKKLLIQNTEAFLDNKIANNVLLYGDAGTGKSTSIKALLNMYYDKGLRMIEVYKHDYKYLPEIISIIKNRAYKFIIYLDDLSFEKTEIEYKYLKAIIEGGLEVKPENVLVYATSNRVHLLHETFSDRKNIEQDDVHLKDTLTEQTSLADRFGLSIGYFSPKRQEFFDMIITMAKENERLALVSREEIIKEASRWNMYHPDISGRSAKQFIAYLLMQRKT